MINISTLSLTHALILSVELIKADIRRDSKS